MARKKRKTPGINGSSSADIAFMLLIFFLITTSMDTDMGLTRRLPPLSPNKEKQPDIEINDRNIMRILVNKNDEIVLLKKGLTGSQDQVINIKLSDLKKRTKEFITNPANRPDLPEKEVREVAGLGQMELVTSSYAISIKNQIETSYQMYISVQNELIAAYNEVWDEFALKHFRKSYKELAPTQQKAVLEAYPLHISEMPLSNLK
ncbi:ExbD/TolR family protein [Porphyromonas loveana]|uniref:Biopolymer transport protein ExbD/TolR n=1 Tax=Porphyromonas loveana TaxID=1884669 RepID=A0A2U1FMN8_9PORP|nr:biopolymer transporter ExbD [Porphyromonas loveana]PVZ13406.1 biopolymer transport protein ExbD/TolR [Porphyromonas loveana]